MKTKKYIPMVWGSKEDSSKTIAETIKDAWSKNLLEGEKFENFQDASSSFLTNPALNSSDSKLLILVEEEEAGRIELQAIIFLKTKSLAIENEQRFSPQVIKQNSGRENKLEVTSTEENKSSDSQKARNILKVIKKNIKDRKTKGFISETDKTARALLDTLKDIDDENKELSKNDLTELAKKVYETLSTWENNQSQWKISKLEADTLYKNTLIDLTQSPNPIIFSAVKTIENAKKEEKKQKRKNLAEGVFGKTVPEPKNFTDAQLEHVRKAASEVVNGYIESLKKDAQDTLKELKENRINLLEKIQKIINDKQLDTTQKIVEQIDGEKIKHKYVEFKDTVFYTKILADKTEKIINNAIAILTGEKPVKEAEEISSIKNMNIEKRIETNLAETKTDVEKLLEDEKTRLENEIKQLAEKKQTVKDSLKQDRTKSLQELHPMKGAFNNSKIKEIEKFYAKQKSEMILPIEEKIKFKETERKTLENIQTIIKKSEPEKSLFEAIETEASQLSKTLKENGRNREIEEKTQEVIDKAIDFFKREFFYGKADSSPSVSEEENKQDTQHTEEAVLLYVPSGMKIYGNSIEEYKKNGLHINLLAQGQAYTSFEAAKAAFGISTRNQTYTDKPDYFIVTFALNKSEIEKLRKIGENTYKVENFSKYSVKEINVIPYVEDEKERARIEQERLSKGTDRSKKMKEILRDMLMTIELDNITGSTIDGLKKVISDAKIKNNKQELYRFSDEETNEVFEKITRILAEKVNGALGLITTNKKAKEFYKKFYKEIFNNIDHDPAIQTIVSKLFQKEKDKVINLLKAWGEGDGDSFRGNLSMFTSHKLENIQEIIDKKKTLLISRKQDIETDVKSTQQDRKNTKKVFLSKSPEEIEKLINDNFYEKKGMTYEQFFARKKAEIVLIQQQLTVLDNLSKFFEDKQLLSKPIEDIEKAIEGIEKNSKAALNISFSKAREALNEIKGVLKQKEETLRYSPQLRKKEVQQPEVPKGKKLVYLTQTMVEKSGMSYITDMVRTESLERLKNSKEGKIYGYETFEDARKSLTSDGMTFDVFYFITTVLVDKNDITPQKEHNCVTFTQGTALSMQVETLKKGNSYTIDILACREMLKFLGEIYKEIEKNKELEGKEGLLLRKNTFTRSETIENIEKEFLKVGYDPKTNESPSPVEPLPVNPQQIQPLFKKVVTHLLSSANVKEMQETKLKGGDVDKIMKEAFSKGSKQKTTKEFYREFLDKLENNENQNIQEIYADISKKINASERLEL